MKKLIGIDYKITDGSSHHSLVLQASLHTLMDEFGQPSYVGSGDQKTQLNWVFYNEKGTITVYDMKEYQKSIFDIDEWNIGSKGFTEEDQEVIAEEAFQ